jgi:hypothetical protein
MGLINARPRRKPAPRSKPVRSQRRLGSLFLPKDGRFRLVGLPIEEIINAGPSVDFASAYPAHETARMLVWMLLPRRGVRHPAIGAGEMFGRPNATRHPANMRTKSDAFPARPIATIGLVNRLLRAAWNVKRLSSRISSRAGP